MTHRVEVRPDSANPQYLEDFPTTGCFASILHAIKFAATSGLDSNRRNHLKLLSAVLFRGRLSVTELQPESEPFAMGTSSLSSPGLYPNASRNLYRTGIMALPNEEHPLDWSSVVSFAFRCAAEEDDWHAGHPYSGSINRHLDHFSFLDSTTGQQASLHAGLTYQRVVSRSLFSRSQESRDYLPLAPYDKIDYAWTCSMRGRTAALLNPKITAQWITNQETVA
ncbi:hypothetical protein DL93DRAFT_2103851 [Clavulina sp. PMI_390]|nr:hypothetical protein DL93DRAFT_2103851 [Clavulina sp. PMI_390]